MRVGWERVLIEKLFITVFTIMNTNPYSLTVAIFMTSCGRCGRGLSNPYSVSAGYGPVCRGKIRWRRYESSSEEESDVGERSDTVNNGKYPHSARTKTFISFHMEDEQQVNLLRHQAENSEQLEFRDTSLKEPFDEKWKTQCTEVIRGSDVVVVAIGEETHTRVAVLWEIEKAHELGVPVIGMRVHSDKNHKIPESMVKHGDLVVEWKLEALQAEIDKQKALKDQKEEQEKSDNLAYA